MSYLVRKIERTRWVGSDEAGSRIKADVVSSCIRPMSSELSVWFAKDVSDLHEARLAMLAAMNKLASVDLIEIPVAEIESAGLKIVESIPTVGPAVLKNRHRDIAELDIDDLHTVAKIVQGHIIEKKCKRLTLAQCKAILEEAVAARKFSPDELHIDISKKLKKAE